MDPVQGAMIVTMLCIFVIFFVGFYSLVITDHIRRKKYNIHRYVNASDASSSYKDNVPSGSAGNTMYFQSKPNYGVMLPLPEYSFQYLPLM